MKKPISTSRLASARGQKAGLRRAAKRIIGLAAFLVLLAGLFIPVLGYRNAELAAEQVSIRLQEQGQDVSLHANARPWIYLGVGIEAGALVLGILGWPDVFAKAAVVSVAGAGVIALIFYALFAA